MGSYETRVCSSEQDAQCTQCETCATGTYLDAWCQGTTSTSCLSCTDSNCAECTGSGAMCTECPNSMVLLNCSCVGGCSPGMFTLSTASGDVRAPCDSSCGTCSGPAVTECISCPGSTVASGGSCVAVANRISGQYHTGSICADRDSSCATCFGGSSGSCISCNSSPVLPVLSGQTCVVTCLTGTYSNTGRCETCSHSCGSCSDAATCTVCTPPLQLEHGRCCRLSIALRPQTRPRSLSSPPCLRTLTSPVDGARAIAGPSTATEIKLSAIATPVAGHGLAPLTGPARSQAPRPSPAANSVNRP